ncbi:hypothetical protein FACS189459_4940 [Bacilli bacterium]|nr:hypothetical protein FACS189459_4940 [Bacilli bacterium]
MRSTKNKGSQSADDGKDYGLSKKAIKQIIKLATISEKKLEDKKISDIFGDSFFESNF